MQIETGVQQLSPMHQAYIVVVLSNVVVVQIVRVNVMRQYTQ